MSTRSGSKRRIRTSAAVQLRARELRQCATAAESMLWQRLRGRRLNGLKFRRQHPLGPFIADFCCPEHRVVVELDGSVHETQTEHDEDRTRQLEAYGYHVLRFRNAEVEQDIEAVLAVIVEACK